MVRPGITSRNPSRFLTIAMFNIGSFEVLLICVIALLVLGPERLPTAVRTTGLWVGRFRRSFYKVKSEIERELNADEIRRQLHNESVMAEIDEVKSEVENVAKDTEKSVNKIVNSANFDPGASEYTDEQLAASNAESEAVGARPIHEEIKAEIAEASEQLQEVKQSLYGSGKNPRLASNSEEEPAANQEEPSAIQEEPSANQEEPSAIQDKSSADKQAAAVESKKPAGE